MGLFKKKQFRVIKYDDKYWIQYKFLFWWIHLKYYAATACDGSEFYKIYGWKYLDLAIDEVERHTKPKEKAKKLGYEVVYRS